MIESSIEFTIAEMEKNKPQDKAECNALHIIWNKLRTNYHNRYCRQMKSLDTPSAHCAKRQLSC
jgi:hypothetical protein